MKWLVPNVYYVLLHLNQYTVQYFNLHIPGDTRKVMKINNCIILAYDSYLILFNVYVHPNPFLKYRIKEK